jgi:hypothetical protein
MPPQLAFQPHARGPDVKRPRITTGGSRSARAQSIDLLALLRRGPAGWRVAPTLCRIRTLPSRVTLNSSNESLHCAANKVLRGG